MGKDYVAEVPGGYRVMTWDATRNIYCEGMPTYMSKKSAMAAMRQARKEEDAYEQDLKERQYTW